MKEEGRNEKNVALAVTKLKGIASRKSDEYDERDNYVANGTVDKLRRQRGQQNDEEGINK